MGKLIAFFSGGWQGTALSAVIAALLSAGAVYYFTALGYRLTIAQMQRDQARAAVLAANASLQQFAADADSIHTSAAIFTKAQLGLDVTFGKISKDFHAATKAAPLPVDCKPDAVRLRALSSAIAAANSAAGFDPGAAMSAHP